MIRITAYVFILTTVVLLTSCSGSSSSTAPVSLAGYAKELVPHITTASGNANPVIQQERAQSFDPTAVSAIPFFVFGSYNEVSSIANDASVTFYNLDGTFSNAQAITDAVPTATAEAGQSDVTWQNLTFHVELGAKKTPTAGTVSPFDFGANSGAPSSAYEALKQGSASNQDIGYAASLAGAWRLDSDIFYLLYAEDGDNTSGGSTSDQKYVIQGSYNTDTQNLIFNQAMRSITVGQDASTAVLVRAEVIGNVNTKNTNIRMVFKKENYKVSFVSKGIIGTGDTIMKVRVVTDGSNLADATEKWICLNTNATIEDFQAMGLNVNENTSAASGRIQFNTDRTAFSGTCATSEFTAAVLAENYFDETSIPNTEGNYYSTLE